MSQRRIHLAGMAVWTLLAVPTVLWWKDSIAWVAFMSLYANLAGHWAGYEGARAADDG